MAIMALISGNIIENVVVCDTLDFAHVLWPSYDILDITHMTPQPGIGWYQSGSNWIQPIVSGSV